MFLHKDKTLIFSVIFLDYPVVWLITLKFAKNNQRIISEKLVMLENQGVCISIRRTTLILATMNFHWKQTKKHQTECVREDEFIMNLLFFENSNILSSKIAYIRSYIRTVYSINRAHASTNIIYKTKVLYANWKRHGFV